MEPGTQHHGEVSGFPAPPPRSTRNNRVAAPARAAYAEPAPAPCSTSPRPSSRSRLDKAQTGGQPRAWAATFPPAGSSVLAAPRTSALLGHGAARTQTPSEFLAVVLLLAGSQLGSTWNAAPPEHSAWLRRTSPPAAQPDPPPAAPLRVAAARGRELPPRPRPSVQRASSRARPFDRAPLFHVEHSPPSPRPASPLPARASPQGRTAATSLATFHVEHTHLGALRPRPGDGPPLAQHSPSPRPAANVPRGTQASLRPVALPGDCGRPPRTPPH